MGAHRMVLPGAQARDRQLAGQAAHGHYVDTWIRRFFRHWLPPTGGQVHPLAIGSID